MAAARDSRVELRWRVRWEVVWGVVRGWVGVIASVQGEAVVGRRSWVRVQRWRAEARRGSVGDRLEARARVECIRGFGGWVWRVGVRVVV